MATLEEVRALNKKRIEAKKQAKLDKAAKKKKDLADVVARGRKAREDRKIRTQKKKALQGDLMGEARLAESRTARARGNDKKADRKLATAERLKGNQKLAEAKEKRTKKLRDMRKSGAKPDAILKEGQKSLPGYTPKKLAGKTTPKVTPKKTTRKSIRATDKGGRSAVSGTMRGKQVDTKIGPNMGQVNKPDAKKKPAVKKDTRSTMQKLFGASEEKRAMGRNQMNRARASMGMKKGGRVKGKCKVDGIAIRGRTRAMHK